MIKAVIFDLDGTLTNTIADLADAVNSVLIKREYKTHSYDEYKYFVGTGSYNLVKKASPEGTSEEEIAEMLKEFFDFYGEHYLDKTKPYENTEEMLSWLSEKGIRLAVCSNKINNMTENVCKKFFSGVFDFTFGQTDRFPLKPDPAAPLWITKQWGVLPSEVIFTGDSGVDMETAKNAGFTAVGCAWGFRTKEELLSAGADYIIENPLELLKIVEEV